MLTGRARTFTLTLACAALPSLGGCGDPLGPDDVAGTFVLARPPRLNAPAGSVPSIVADTFFISSNGYAQRHLWSGPSPASGEPATTTLMQSTFAVSLEGRAIGFEWLCPSGQICAAISIQLWFELDPTGRVMRARDGSGAAYVRIGRTTD